MDKLAWMFPEFRKFETLSFESQLSTVFVASLLAISSFFLCKSFYSGFRAWRRISWLKKIISTITPENI